MSGGVYHKPQALGGSSCQSINRFPWLSGHHIDIGQIGCHRIVFIGEKRVSLVDNSSCLLKILRPKGCGSLLFHLLEGLSFGINPQEEKWNNKNKFIHIKLVVFSIIQLFIL
jgi:hypothetical protein